MVGFGNIIIEGIYLNNWYLMVVKYGNNKDF